MAVSPANHTATRLNRELNVFPRYNVESDAKNERMPSNPLIGTTGGCFLFLVLLLLGGFLLSFNQIPIWVKWSVAPSPHQCNGDSCISPAGVFGFQRFCHVENASWLSDCASFQLLLWFHFFFVLLCQSSQCFPLCFIISAWITLHVKPRGNQSLSRKIPFPVSLLHSFIFASFAPSPTGRTRRDPCDPHGLIPINSHDWR